MTFVMFNKLGLKCHTRIGVGFGKGWVGVGSGLDRGWVMVGSGLGSVGVGSGLDRGWVMVGSGLGLVGSGLGWGWVFPTGPSVAIIPLG